MDQVDPTTIKSGQCNIEIGVEMYIMVDTYGYNWIRECVMS